MTWSESRRHARRVAEVRRALTALRIAKSDDEDIAVAAARLENWLNENETRWVTS